MAKDNPQTARNRSLRTRYGLSAEEYDQILVNQGRACAICRTPASTLGRRLDVDHDHGSGRVRGLLCGKCNMGLGCFQDTMSLLAAAARYLDRP